MPATTRQTVQQYRVPNRTIAYAILIADVLFYAITLLIAVSHHQLPVAILASVLNGLAIGLLFLVGHDCCHRSFLPTRVENYLVGQLAMLPALHPYSLWELGHNQVHHGFTNLGSRDYVYRPLSKADYDALTSWRRCVYRFHRSFAGHASYYLVEIWKKHLFFPSSSEVGPYKRRYHRDHAMVVGWLFLFLVGITQATNCAVQALSLGFVVPFIVWNFLMGAVIYLHHTNPAVRWYEDENKWPYPRFQEPCAVVIRFTPLVDFILHRIMEHSAHHLNALVPMYRLREAQRVLAPDAFVMQWTLRNHIELTRMCRLYDYQNGTWLDYDGKPVCAGNSGQGSAGKS